MLYIFGFQRIGVVMSDLYFIDPDPAPGQEGAERGVRLEVRFLERQPLEGSIYSAQPIAVGRPLWRADMLERADGPAGTFDRTHHHPAFRGWEPGSRRYEKDMSAAPLDWVAERLGDPEALLREAEVSVEDIPKSDIDDLRQAVPEILDTLKRLLDRVHAGELAQRPSDEPLAAARASWL